MKPFEEIVEGEFERPDIDNLTILQAATMLVDYCLSNPDDENNSMATRMVVGGLYVAVAITQDEREGGFIDDDRWVHRLRIAQHRIPFRSAKGIEVRLPYGSDLGSEVIAPSMQDTQKSRAGVCVSFGGSQNVNWHPTELFQPGTGRPYNYWEDTRPKPFDLNKNTVGQVDQSLREETIRREQEDIGFLLKDVIHLVDDGCIVLLQMQHDKVIDLRSPDS
jgi:hypothetical protein